MSFVNLPNHQLRLDAEQMAPDDGIWAEVGFPEVLGSKHRDERNKTVTTTVYCLTAVGGVDRVSERDGLDYYDGRVTYDGGHAVPVTFRGMSGGGLWFLRIGRKGERLVVRDRFLTGVVFYELATEGAVSSIRSHGRKTLYDYAVNRLILGAPA